MKPSIPTLTQGSSPLQGPSLSRRGFLELSAGGLVLSWFLKSPASAFAASSAAGVTPKGTAKNAIFIWLPGAPSQVDTFDLKEGAWTPTDFKPTSYGADLRFPQGLLPNIANHLGELAIVRSYMAWALVHGLGQTWAQVARNPTGATGSIAPNIGSVVALELEAKRAATDVMPGFMALNSGTAIEGAGYLPSTFSPFSIQPANQADQGLPSLTHPDPGRFTARYADLEKIDAQLRAGNPLGKQGSDAALFYAQAKTLMDAGADPEFAKIFMYTTDEATRYGGTAFGNSCNVARKVLAARRGTRFVQITQGGWDMHNNIYADAGNTMYSQGTIIDAGIANLLVDLKATPGETAGKTLLDETLVFIAGEFGRTVGALNGQAGRDHFMRTSVVLAGGGIKGGQVIGATDATGANLKESGWSENREARPEDLASTVYSALGIDWTTVRTDDPLGRGFEYIPYAKDGVYKPIDVLFG